MENWKSQYDYYDEDRQLEIKKGIESGVDISLYDGIEFSAIQMQQIRLALEEGIDASIFASPEYDWYQMDEISKGLYDKLDVSKYADPSISYDKMRQIRLGLVERIDLSTVLDLEAPVMEQIRFAIENKVDIIPYVKSGYSAKQLKEIRLSIEESISIDSYIDKNTLGVSIEQIRLGLKKGLDVKIYTNKGYTWQQMKQIRLGLESKIDTSLYDNNLYSWQQMKQIRLGLEEGLDVEVYRSFSHTAKEMEALRKKLIQIKESDSKKKFKVISGEDVQLQISDDEMIAKICIAPEKVDEIRVESIKNFLLEKGITYGVLEESIEEALKLKNTGSYFVAAKGRRAEPGDDGEYSVYFDKEDTKSPEILEDGTRDYSQTKWFEIVPKNKVIAVYKPPTKGKDGINIFGKTIKAKSGKQKKMRFGKNITCSEDGKTFSAAIEGEIQYLKDKNELIINGVHVVHSNERLIENLYTQESILIEAEPGGGIEIRSQGDVVIYGILGPAKIKSGGTVFIRGGVKGKDKCVIEAKKDVIGKFLESCEIHAKGNVIAGHILNCNIETENKVLLFGNKSAIVGGYTKAEKSIDTYNVGNINHSETILEVGKSGFSRRDLLNVNKRVEFVEAELFSIENSIEKMKKFQRMEELSEDEIFIKLTEAKLRKEEELYNLKEKANTLESAIANNIEANVIIRGTAYLGVKAVMAGMEWEATDNSSVELYLSKNNYIRVKELSHYNGGNS